jgi:hypothetical protein
MNLFKFWKSFFFDKFTLHFGGGGGGGSGTSTQISDVPDWAKPYAKTALSQASQLTDITKNPYQAYTGERAAQFTPLQQQAYQGAAAMQAGPQAFQSQVGQYMSPYMQNVVDIQQREAQRQADIAGTQQQAQATKSGAFGGGRDAIMRAEAARNLALQKGDIQARGLQSAYENATNQYNTGQSQGMAINQLQNQYGGQQQQQVQNILNQQYQDFLSQKQYPYQQLEFMSGLLRGTPMGTVSSMYQAPGSMLGQVAGLGMGAYGLSQMGLKFAGGGSITNPSEEKLEDMVDGLSDEQLQQIIRRPTSEKALRAAQAELAMRASMKNGIAGALSGPAAERVMPTEESMARGGVVAFAKGGDEGEKKDTVYYEDPMGAPSSASGRELSLSDFVPDLRKKVTEGQKYKPGLQGMLFGYDVEKEEVGAGRGKTPASAYDSKAASENYDKASRSSTTKGGKSSTSGAGSSGLVQAATRIAEQQGVPKEDFESIMDRMMAKFKGANDKDLQGIKDYIAKSGKEAEDIKSQMLNKAITEFGFNLAAQASKPGQGKGLRGLLASGAAAAPTISASVAESQKLIRAAQDNARKMEVEFAKYKVALDKGDQQTAISLASNIRMMQQQQAQLNETIRHNKAVEGLQGQRVAAMAGRGQEKTFAPILRGIGQANQMASKNAMELIKARPDLIQKGEKPEDALERVRSALAAKYRKEAVPMFGPTGKVYGGGNDDDMEE